MHYVIIGSDGYIGSYLYEHLRADGYRVDGTTKRRECTGTKIYFDMLDNDVRTIGEEWHGKTAIICAAKSKIDECAMDYERAYNLNVTRTVKIVGDLLTQGAQVIAFSSDQVFDGRMGNYREDSLKNPLNSYGRMKADMEEALLALTPGPCIFRIAKTISNEAVPVNVFTEWYGKKPQDTIYCIKDNIISFVYIGDIKRAVVKAAELGLRGLYNIASDETCSRTEMAAKFMHKAGLTDVNIREVDADYFHFREQRPLNVSMSNAKFKAAADFIYTPMEEIMQAYIDLNGGNK